MPAISPRKHSLRLENILKISGEIPQFLPIFTGLQLMKQKSSVLKKEIFPREFFLQCIL